MWIQTLHLEGVAPSFTLNLLHKPNTVRSDTEDHHCTTGNGINGVVEKWSNITGQITTGNPP
jgi:hypothetical protein